MKQTLFVTTFSKNGYFVYGKKWIETFLEHTKDLPDITAKIWVDGMSQEEIEELSVKDKIAIVDYEQDIPEQALWKDMFEKESTHNFHVKSLSVKFSFKSFVISKSLKQNTDKYVIWLDADCVFKSSDLQGFAERILDGKFIACQKESGSDHVESGIVVFDTEHADRMKFVEAFDGYYYNDVNSFGELFDGFVINRTLFNTPIDFVDLNERYGLQGVQSDPNLTFLNPEINKRFHHNIGITGKRSYEDWRTYSRQDKYFQMIHGIDPSEVHATLQENVSRINDTVLQLAMSRNVR